MSDAKFKVGDQVGLISGGPVMTVDNVNDFGKFNGSPTLYTCKWFDDKNTIQKDILSEDSLKSYTAPEFIDILI